MQEQNIQILRQMRAELMERVTALDSVISLLERFDGDPAEEPIPIAEEVTVPTYKGTAKNTRFTSAIDLSQQSEPAGPWECPACGAINPVNRKTCSECKTKRP